MPEIEEIKKAAEEFFDYVDEIFSEYHNNQNQVKKENE